MKGDSPTEGDVVEVEYTNEGLTRRGRQTLEAEVQEVMGETVYLANPFGEETPTLVLDPEGDLWARDEDGNDGLFGTNARVV